MHKYYFCKTSHDPTAARYYSQAWPVAGNSTTSFARAFLSGHASTDSASCMSGDSVVTTLAVPSRKSPLLPRRLPVRDELRSCN